MNPRVLAVVSVMAVTWILLSTAGAWLRADNKPAQPEPGGGTDSTAGPTEPGGPNHRLSPFSPAALHPRQQTGRVDLQPLDPQQVDSQRLEKAIDLAADYLVGACGDDGRFVYRINVDPAVTPKPKYNILRHSGAIYALATYQQRRPKQQTRQAILRAAGFLKRTAMLPVPGHDDLLAIWSHPGNCDSQSTAEAKLGGTGLGLVALMSLEKVEPGSTSLDELRKLGRFLVFMQNDDGSFCSKYIPSRGGKYRKWVSLYYPGEAALGLLMLYDVDPSPVWLQAATDCIAYLARIRRNKVAVEPDHWALLATAKLLSVAESPPRPISREAALRHAADVCERILADIPRYPPQLIAAGCLTEDGYTCQAATRLEGLLAAATFLPEEDRQLRQRIESTTDAGIAFLLRCQVPSGRYAGGITRAAVLPDQHGRYQAIPNQRATEVRIDYVQHALCAMIQYQDRL
jgi:hypothetical protein